MKIQIEPEFQHEKWFPSRLLNVLMLSHGSLSRAEKFCAFETPLKPVIEGRKNPVIEQFCLSEAQPSEFNCSRIFPE